MTSILKASTDDFQLLADIGKTSFIESHGSSASDAIINKYVSEKYNIDIFKAELSDPYNFFHVIFYNGQPAGYSKIVFNVPHTDITTNTTAKLERLYLLKQYYNLNLGFTLLNFNIELSKQNKQSGMWLFVWKENKRAVNFYTKSGFKIIGSYDFKLTPTHSNPNHIMLLEF